MAFSLALSTNINHSLLNLLYLICAFFYKKQRFLDILKNFYLGFDFDFGRKWLGICISCVRSLWFQLRLTFNILKMEVSTSILLDKAQQTSARYRLECLQWEIQRMAEKPLHIGCLYLVSKTSKNTPKIGTLNISKS